MRVLVTGGAGYIGSHAAKRLAGLGHEVFVYDNLSRGNRWAVKWGPLIEGDVLDEEKLTATIVSARIEAVMHFAALAYAGESMTMPSAYFRNNVQGALSLLRAMNAGGAAISIFSSSCSIFGNPAEPFVSEESPLNPLSPYGESKRIVEQVLRWSGECGGLRWSALRYFNAAGCDPEGEIGEWHDPETHIIPLVLKAASDSAAPFHILGANYDTADGTCIRDYIHVTDLADAHVRALDYLARGGPSCAFNLGTGKGYSVREVIAAAERVTGRRVACREAPARPGDPARVIAASAKARTVLGWAPAHSDLESILATAWNWQCSMESKSGQS